MGPAYKALPARTEYVALVLRDDPAVVRISVSAHCNAPFGVTRSWDEAISVNDVWLDEMGIPDLSHQPSVYGNDGARDVVGQVG